MEKGLLYIFTGDGKGKTSAALGVAMRMLLNQKKVVWISWYKSDDWDISEKKMAEVFKDQLQMFWAGKGFYIKDEAVTSRKKGLKMAKANKAVVVDYESEEGHKLAAKTALKMLRCLFEDIRMGKKQVDLIIADEINQTINDGLLSIDEVKAVLKNQSGAHVVLTGRQCHEEILAMADLVTEMTKIRHPFDVGVMAVKGLDF